MKICSYDKQKVNINFDRGFDWIIILLSFDV
jgi:hypothetical protein